MHLHRTANKCLRPSPSTITHIYPSVLQALAGRGVAGCLEWVISGVLRGFIQDPASELRRIPIPRTWVNRTKKRGPSPPTSREDRTAQP